MTTPWDRYGHDGVEEAHRKQREQTIATGHGQIRQALQEGPRDYLIEVASRVAFAHLDDLAAEAKIDVQTLFEAVVKKIYPQSETMLDDYNDFMSRFYRFSRGHRMGAGMRKNADYVRRRSDLQEAWGRLSEQDRLNARELVRRIGGEDILREEILGNTANGSLTMLTEEDPFGF